MQIKFPSLKQLPILWDGDWGLKNPVDANCSRTDPLETNIPGVPFINMV